MKGEKMKKVILLTLVLTLAITAVAKADFTFGEPVNIGPPINSSADEGSRTMSPDGLELYFDSSRQGWDLWVTRRTTVDGLWGEPEKVWFTVNNFIDFGPCLSANGLELYYSSNRDGAFNTLIAKRATLSDPWEEPVNIGPVVSRPSGDFGPHLSADGLELFFGSNRSGGSGGTDLWVTKRETIHDPWSKPVNLGVNVNSSAHDNSPVISSDGLLLFFESVRPGGYGDFDIYMTRRATIDGPWEPAVNLGPLVNSSLAEYLPGISPDGRQFEFIIVDHPDGLGGYDIWQAQIEPVVDLNDDGIVDGADLSIIGDYWGTDNSLCDIGPMPWGDGIVDVQDLIVMAEYLSPAKPEVHVNEADDGGQIELEPSQILVVTLQSNPTTGYSWHQAENQEPFLEQMGEPQFTQAPTDGPPVVGAGGWEVFRFKAVSAGQMTLELGYRRPWEEGVDPILTFSIDVIVK
jgi:predicted secreted protein/Tol biopolymer transport system component